MIIVVLLLALGLRLIQINQSLWLDEADNVLAARMFDFSSFISKYSIGDYHPPGYFALIWIWTHTFGFSEISVRLPSILLGVGTVFFTYLIGKELFNKRVAIIGSLLLAIAPLHVYYSQEARMYSLSAFSVASLSYFLIKMIKGKRFAWIGYAISATLVLYSDYVTYLIFPAHFIFLLITSQKVWKKWFASLAISAITFLPWMTVFPQQIMVGQKAAIDLPGWKQVAGGADLKNLVLVWIKILVGRISFDNKYIYGGVVSILSGLSFVGIGKALKGKIEFPQKLLIIWFLVPLILAWGISFYIPMLSYFRMIYILPAFYLLLAYGISSLPKIFPKIVLSIFILISLFCLGIYYTNPKFQREDWRDATKFIDNNAKESSIVLFEDNHVKFPFLYYKESNVPAFGGLKNVQARTLNDVENIDKLLDGKKQIYLFEYLVEITDPQRLLEKKIRELGFVQKQAYDFPGVGFVTLYTHF